jgi:hypothetical protein
MKRTLALCALRNDLDEYFGYYAHVNYTTRAPHQ